MAVGGRETVPEQLVAAAAARRRLLAPRRAALLPLLHQVSNISTEPPTLPRLLSTR